MKCARLPPLVNGGSQLLIAKMGAAQYLKGRTLVDGGTYPVQEVAPVNIYNFFDLAVSGKLKQLPSPLVNEETLSNFNFFDCKDINNNGLPDLVS